MNQRPRHFAATLQGSLAALHQHMLVFARDQTGQLVHVDAVARGKACRCRCLACDEELIARHGDIKAHSFAHASGTECQYAIDAVFCSLAREMIAARGALSTPQLTLAAIRTGPLAPVRCTQTIASKSVAIDAARLDTRVHPQRPSVVLAVRERELIVEVTFAHRLDARKRDAIVRLGLPAIEIDVAQANWDTLEQLEYLLIDDVRHKHWIHNPKALAIQEELDARADAEIATQQAQHARIVCEQQQKQQEQQAARELANRARQRDIEHAVHEKFRAQAEQDHRARQNTAQRGGSQRIHTPSPSAASGKGLHYALGDGGLLLSHESGGCLKIMPETGAEAALAALVAIGVTRDPESGAYFCVTEYMADVMLTLSTFNPRGRSV